ncbi:TraR/DksA C4-type zinc finger protein [Paenibacillus marinisediminis]
MSHLTSTQLHQLRTKLLDMKKQFEQREVSAERFGLDSSMRENTGELSGIDNHPGDLGSEMFERGKDLALNELHETQWERIDTALQRMDEGSYGTCTVCGQDIPFERLEAVPETMYCIEHSPKYFSANPRPVEEEFLSPPFGRTSLDELDTQNGFDGEDAWQIVESWGTSDTPAMHEEYDIFSYDQMMIEAADELDGFVEPFESFVATDITGKDLVIVRNHQYEKYMSDGEGEPLLEEDIHYDENDE